MDKNLLFFFLFNNTCSLILVVEITPTLLILGAHQTHAEPSLRLMSLLDVVKTINFIPAIAVRSNIYRSALSKFSIEV